MSENHENAKPAPNGDAKENIQRQEPDSRCEKCCSQSDQCKSERPSERRPSESRPSSRTSGKYYDFDVKSRLDELVGLGGDIFVVSTRYGSMCHSGLFFSTMRELHKLDSIIVKTEMGLEMADLLTDLELYVPKEGEGIQFCGEVVRVAEKEDIVRWDYIQEELQPAEFTKCCALIKEHDLPMKLVDVEHLFGGDRIVFYFLADGRVDFRSLVRDLSKEFKTRIEMRQIGVRDEARLLADFEHCGRPLCCKTFVDELKPVSMKMAKQQKTTLDPAKISGRCGRLMCCLRFEDEVYTHLKKSLPKKGQIVVLNTGKKGRVNNINLLREMVHILDENDNQVWVSASEIKKVLED